MKRKLGFALCLLAVPLWAAPVEEAGQEEAPTSRLRVVFSKVNNYNLFKEMRQAIRQSGSVVKMIPRSEAPELIEFDSETTETPAALMETLESRFSEQATLKLKKLPSGISELTITAK